MSSVFFMCLPTKVSVCTRETQLTLVQLMFVQTTSALRSARGQSQRCCVSSIWHHRLSAIMILVTGLGKPRPSLFTRLMPGLQSLP